MHMPSYKFDYHVFSEAAKTRQSTSRWKILVILSVLYCTHELIHVTPPIYFISSLGAYFRDSHRRRCGKIHSSGNVCHGDLKSGNVSGFVFLDGLRPREYVEQVVPEVLLAPSEVGGAFEIELDLLGQLIVLG
ncbi:hypothetical protein CEXT_435251 [Caerostris extrusa]|uniref:Protein kinase domain-containing protein n=1 Tax=Caerostris extrusa TaxID=172846 RepID=A0AAV4SML6_CAEEX|nr:hypothetical protein CEXT_435251 [Caerostris extrusa]